MDKDQELTKLVEQLLNTYTKKLSGEYQRAYNSMRDTIYKYVNKYAIDGKLTRSEMYKYNRFQKLHCS